VDSVGGREEMRRGAGAGEGGGELAGDVAGFTDATGEDRIFAIEDQIDGAVEGFVDVGGDGFERGGFCVNHLFTEISDGVCHFYVMEEAETAKARRKREVRRICFFSSRIPSRICAFAVSAVSTKLCGNFEQNQP
jgi:hypothetical protein